MLSTDSVAMTLVSLSPSQDASVHLSQTLLLSQFSYCISISSSFSDLPWGSPPTELTQPYITWTLRTHFGNIPCGNLFEYGSKEI